MRYGIPRSFYMLSFSRNYPDCCLTLQYWKLVIKDSVKFWKLCSNLTKHTWQPRHLRSLEPETHSFRMFPFDLPLWELKGKIGMKKGKLISQSVLEYLLLTLKLVSSKKKLWKCFESFFFWQLNIFHLIILAQSSVGALNKMFWKFHKITKRNIHGGVSVSVALMTFSLKRA